MSAMGPVPTQSVEGDWQGEVIGGEPVDTGALRGVHTVDLGGDVWNCSCDEATEHGLPRASIGVSHRGDHHRQHDTPDQDDARGQLGHTCSDADGNADHRGQHHHDED